MTNDSDAARLEPWQWRGWSEQATANDPMVIAEPDEKAAYKRGYSGIRPDAQALTAARQAGVAEERARWLEVLAQTASEHPYDKTSREYGNSYAEGWTDALDLVEVRACNAATETGEAQ